MEKVPVAILVIGVAFAWLGLAVVVLLRMRRRRNGSSLVASASPPADTSSNHPNHPRRTWHRIRPVTGQAPGRRRRLGVRKVRG
ncbi:hypothetical protein [Arthrobacter sp. ZGTC412]|uniref:hypothetical protein n=1 Tax=Arthrobacter sp. ZGTC412 TaxID=2058900 RepID=UPI000CE4240B|nr:hypothetical protein [Arthrobacter sp. ZGTC412]